VTSANPRSVGSVGGLKSNVVNLVLRVPAPTSVNIALPQGPTNHIRLDAPDQGARGGVDQSNSNVCITLAYVTPYYEQPKSSTTTN
jgi:hypothetical protein